MNQGGWGRSDGGVRHTQVKEQTELMEKRRVNAVFVYAGLKIMVAESKGAESNGNKSEAADSRDVHNL